MDRYSMDSGERCFIVRPQTNILVCTIGSRFFLTPCLKNIPLVLCNFFLKLHLENQLMRMPQRAETPGTGVHSDLKNRYENFLFQMRCPTKQTDQYWQSYARNQIVWESQGGAKKWRNFLHKIAVWQVCATKTTNRPTTQR